MSAQHPPISRTDTSRLVVVGGGLAGLAAAISAADAGWRVTLLESRPRLGGATYSFVRSTAVGDLKVDNGQHVFLRCCTAYREFLRRLGVEHLTHLQPRLDVPVIDPVTGRVARLRRDRLPAPLHLSRALARYAVLTPAQRLRAIRGALALGRVDREAEGADATTLGAWLRAHGQTAATISRLFDVFTVATLNAPAEQASLRLGAMVFQDGLLRDASACDIGYSRVPLGDLHGEAAARVLASRGAQVHTRTRVRAIERADNANEWVVRTDDTNLHADAVVMAVPHDIASRLLPPGAVADPTVPAQLAVSPILNVHLVYDRTVMHESFVAAVDSPAQFVFDRTEPSGLDSRGRPGLPGGQYVAVSVSAADEWIDTPAAQLREFFVPEMARILPGARSAQVREFFVTRERAATFRPVPGSASYRLPTHTQLPGLYLAGAWTATGWPATMESAVRSGVAAARALGSPAGVAGALASPTPAGLRHDRDTTRNDEAVSPEKDAWFGNARPSPGVESDESTRSTGGPTVHGSAASVPTDQQEALL